MKSTSQQQKEIIKQRIQDNTATIEVIKTTLRRYSRLLRRDFLMSLVRLCALELHLRTTRIDWRTRDGSLLFLCEHWLNFRSLLDKDGFVRWFCYAYSRCIGVLSNRQFVSFLYQHWETYKILFDNKITIAFINVHRSAITSFLEGASSQEVFQDLIDNEVCASIVSVIETFHSSLASNHGGPEEKADGVQADEQILGGSSADGLKSSAEAPTAPIAGFDALAASVGDAGDPFIEFEDDLIFGCDDGLSVAEFDGDFFAVGLCM